MVGLHFNCPCCGERHEGLPDLAYRAPCHWDASFAGRDPARNRLDTDLCMIDGTHFFIRCVLLVPIRGTEARLGRGVWLSQSEANFRHYLATFDGGPENATFGYLSNRLPGYPDTLNLRALAHWQPGGKRPIVELEDCGHPLVQDWREGITLDRAIAFALPVLHPEPPSTAH